MDLTITEETTLTGRALRKWRAGKKVEKIYKKWLKDLERIVNEPESNSEKAYKILTKIIANDTRKDVTNKVLYDKAQILFDTRLEEFNEL